MNAGLDNYGDVLIQNLLQYQHIFDKIYICDGNLTQQANKIYKQFPSKVEIIDMPWDDNYVRRYRKIAETTGNSDFILHLDSDEIPSEELIFWLANREYFKSKINMYWLPCILHIAEDGKKYYPVEPAPSKEYSGQWTKKILYRKTNTLHFKHGGSHVIPDNEPRQYLSKPYYHMKSLESFVYNDVYQAFLSPEGQGYTPVEAAQFKMFTKQYKTTAEFKKATLESNWPPMLEKFAWSKRREFNRPISRLAWVYFVLEGAIRPGQDEDMQWCRVKQHVLGKESMELLRENKEKGNFIEIA